jgi:hypothetical protein
MPPKKELKLDKDGLQQHLGARVTPAQLQLKEIGVLGGATIAASEIISARRGQRSWSM